MADILEIREKLDDTNAAIARLSRTVAENPSVLSLRVTEHSLRKRQRQLEEEFNEIAEELNLDICAYRLIPDRADVPIAGIAIALADFQDMFTVFFDQRRLNAPKTTAHVGVESATISTLNFAYTFTGSIGVVLTARKDSELFIGGRLEKTIGDIKSVAKAKDPDQILRHARKIGAAPIRSFYKWAKDQVQFGLSSEIKWKRNGGVRREFLIQSPELRNLSEIIDRTSEEVGTRITVTGELTEASVKRKRFSMTTELGQEISGHFDDAISADHEAAVPHRYTAEIAVTTKKKFSLDQDKIDYFLEDLREP